MAQLLQPDDAGIAQAARHLCAGELIAFPTETVYGLGADARNPEAVARIFAAKRRPADHPLIVHIADPDALFAWVAQVPDTASRLARAFWPGPLTMILTRAEGVPDAVTGGQLSVGVRCPSHPVARALLGAFARLQGSMPAGLAAPSANLFGRISPTTAAHVLEDFADTDLRVLDGANSDVGLESTIIDLSRPAIGPVLLRPGRILASQIMHILGQEVRSADAAAPRASGTLASHYAPTKPLRLISANELQALDQHSASTSALLAFTRPALSFAWARQAPLDDAAYAHGLYHWLREMDHSEATQLLVERVPSGEAWAAIADRLSRAAA